jgi:hypothetical protein
MAHHGDRWLQGCSEEGGGTSKEAKFAYPHSFFFPFPLCSSHKNVTVQYRSWQEYEVVKSCAAGCATMPRIIVKEVQ